MDKRIINELKALEDLGFQGEFLMHSFLTATASLASKRYSVMVGDETEPINESIVEPLILYTVLVAPPGSNKTGSMNVIMKPIYKLERELYLKYQENIEKFEATNKDSSLKPQQRHLFVTDLTLESLHNKLTDQNPNILIFADEFHGFLENTNRYNKGSDYQSYTSLWNGNPLSITRKHQRSLYIMAPRVSILGGIQTQILTRLIQQNKRWTESGFLSRFSFVIPENISVPSYRDAKRSGQTSFLPDFFMELFHKMDEIDHDIILAYKKDAWEIMSGYIDDELKSRIEDDEISSVKKDILSKHRRLVNRYALVFQVIQNILDGDLTQNIGIESAMDAIEIIKIIEKYKFKLYDGLDEAPIDKLDPEQRMIYTRLPNEFSADVARRVAAELNMSPNKVYHFIQNKKFFQKIKYNVYGKVFPS